MLDFNLQFLSKQLKHETKLKALKGYHDANVENMVNLINMIHKKNKQHSYAISFVHLTVARRAKVEKLLCVQKIISRSLEDSFFKIKRYSVLNDKSHQIKQQNQLNYPVSIINRIYNSNRLSKLESAWSRIGRYRRFMDLVEIRINYLQEFCIEYPKKAYAKELFIIFKRTLLKQSQYVNHTLNLQKIFEILRIKKLFEGLAVLTVKTQMKTIAELDKEKAGKKDQSVKSNAKRTELVNELKRKTNNLKAQVTEEIMRNNKKKVDGSKQNGMKMMKKNEELRGYELGLSSTSAAIQKMEKQLERKENFIKNRPKKSIAFEYLRAIYTQISQSEGQEVPKAQIDSKIGKGQLTEFANSSNYTTSLNIKLKYLINLHEQLQSSKKSDVYLNLDNENTCLKGLVGSLIRMQYFEPKRDKIRKNVDQINSNLIDLKQEMSQLRLQKLDNRKK